MRDITLEETVYFNFTTRAFASGVPTTLAGSPVLSVLESNNATPITSGVSVSVDRASVTGLNQATVVATAANGYEAGKSYCAYISTGTVGGVSVIGEVVAEFTIQAGAAFTRLGAPVGASISADVAAIKAETVTILADTNDIQTRLPAALVGGRMDSSVGAMAANVMTAAAAAADLTTELQAGLSTLDAAGVRTAVGLASANLDTQLSAIDDFLDTEVAAIKAKTDNLPSDPADASDVAAVVAAVKVYADRTVVRGTVSATAPTTTTFTSSALSPVGVAADQFKGRIIVFDNDTTTTALRGQATDITASSAAANPLFTFTALTTAPASGDTFSIL